MQAVIHFVVDAMRENATRIAGGRSHVIVE
jgi:hypothetical protein